MYEYDLALNNPQGFICYKTPTNLHRIYKKINDI